MHFTCPKMHSTVRASLAGILPPEVNSPMQAGEWNFTPLTRSLVIKSEI